MLSPKEPDLLQHDCASCAKSCLAAAALLQKNHADSDAVQLICCATLLCNSSTKVVAIRAQGTLLAAACSCNQRMTPQSEPTIVSPTKTVHHACMCKVVWCVIVVCVYATICKEFYTTNFVLYSCQGPSFRPASHPTQTSSVDAPPPPTIYYYFQPVQPQPVQPSMKLEAVVHTCSCAETSSRGRGPCTKSAAAAAAAATNTQR